MKIRPAASMLTLDESLARVVDIPSRQALMQYLSEHFDFWSPTDQNVTIEPYAKDPRIGWYTYLICVAGKAALFSDGPCPTNS
jgi:hypothetical protein